MNHQDYLAIKDQDTALAVRLAVTMGWDVCLGKTIRVVSRNRVGHPYFIADFNPFTDASIPYGLIGNGVWGVYQFYNGGKFMANGEQEDATDSKTHAIINAYCAADVNGYWAKFIGEKK